MKTGIQAFDLGAGIGAGAGLAGLGCNCLGGRGDGFSTAALPGTLLGFRKIGVGSPGPISVTVPQTVYSQIGREADSKILNGLGGPAQINIDVPQSVMRWSDATGGFSTPSATGTFKGLGKARKQLRGLGDVYTPTTGDVVNVLNDIVGKDANGNDYTIKAGSFFTPNVVMIQGASPSGNTLQINDGTSYSPITTTYTDNQNSFELANFINKFLFKPFAGTIKVVNTVATDTANVVQNAADTASNTTKVASMLVPLALAGGALFIGVYAYKHYIKGNDKIKAPKVNLLGHKKRKRK